MIFKKVNYKMETIEIELSDSILLDLALEAHKKNITLNQFINDILRDYFKKVK